MSSIDNYKLLMNRLSEYLYDKKFDMSGVASMLTETIFKCVDLDTLKLSSALEQINVVKAKKAYFKEPKFFKFDVSSDTQTVFVKFVINPEGEPIMLFFNNANIEQSPFFKVTASVDADGKHVVAETTSDQTSQRIANVLKYSFLDEYNSSAEGLSVKKKTNAFSKYSDMVVDRDTISPHLNRNFLHAIAVALKNNNVKFPDMDAHAAGALVASFCEIIGGLCVGEDEFSFDELSCILNGVLTDDNDAPFSSTPKFLDAEKLSDIAQFLADTKEGGVYDFNTFSNDGKPLYLSVNRNPKYVSVDIDEKESKKTIHKYIIVETTNGFTIYRSKNPRAQSSPTDSFVINLSGSSMSFKAVGNATSEFGETPMELVLNITGGGDMSLSSVVESKLAHGQLSFGKHGAEDILNSRIFSAGAANE